MEGVGFASCTGALSAMLVFRDLCIAFAAEFA
jgi:hypothetical protein